MAFRSEYQDWARELSQGPRPVIWPLVKTGLSFTLGCAACWLIAVFIGAFS